MKNGAGPQTFGVEVYRLLACQPAARMPLHLSALCPSLEASLFHTDANTTMLPTPHPPEQLGRDAIHSFLDTSGRAHRCDFTCCLASEDCKSHFNSG